MTAVLWQSPLVFKGLEATSVTGANSRARTCTQEYAAAAKLNQKNHLRAHRKDPDWEAAVPAREFAPVTVNTPVESTTPRVPPTLQSFSPALEPKGGAASGGSNSDPSGSRAKSVAPVEST